MKMASVEIDTIPDGTLQKTNACCQMLPCISQENYVSNKICL